MNGIYGIPDDSCQVDKKQDATYSFGGESQESKEESNSAIYSQVRGYP